MIKKMKKYINKIAKIVCVLALGLALSGCTNELRQEPITDLTAAGLYKDFANYNNLLAKLYGGVAVGGQAGGDGNGDIADIDGGFSNYTRLLFYLQEITTDEAVIGWNDGTLPEFHKMSWTPSNEFNNAMYYRIYTEIAFCNEFIKNTKDDMLAQNGISGSNLDEAKAMRGEARFLRAQSYYHLLDLYGNVAFVDETTLGTIPKQIKRADLFNYVESELLLAADEMKAAKSNLYGRADKAAAWTLLARLYLNAQIYNGSNRYNDVITYTKKIIDAGYSLMPEYADLFLADNNINNPEVILPIVYDGVHTQTYGGTTFLVHAAIGGSMDPADFGVNGGWGGLRVTKSFVQKYDPADKRGRFFTNGQTLEINDIGNFNDGYAFIKYKNLQKNGSVGQDNNFVDADLQLYRLADVYLMYAEATLRGGNGNMADAIHYVNLIRERAFGNNSNNVTALSLDFILDERSRELGWELTRRTDLIRFGKFTTAAYLWPWKGNVKNGTSVSDHRNLFPIPINELVVNHNLIQNPGY